MNNEDITKIIEAFSILDRASLNEDPFSFKGKFVTILNGNEILKIATTFDFNGELDIINKAISEGINFFLPFDIIYQGQITLGKQLKLDYLPLETFHKTPLKVSLNSWCQGRNIEEETISGIVAEHYGQDMWEKISQFTQKTNLGNIYWRNIGFNKGIIQCFDFQCGLARDEKGRYYV